jgi:hypothetical protein
MANYWKLYKKIEAFYFGLGKIRCPALNNQEVVFGRLGFRHFTRNKNGIRPISDQIRRLRFFHDHVIELVSSKDTEAAFSSKGEKCDNIHFYTLTKKINGELFIKATIRKNNLGIFHFLSIMEE